MTQVRRLHFVLAISADEYLRYYRGSARDVLARCVDGRWVRFPANRLQAFVTREGIHGEFILEFDQDNKFIAMKKISS